MAQSEHRAVLLLLALAVAGQAVRHWLSPSADAPGEVRLLGSSGTTSLTAHRDSARMVDRPLTSTERIDVNTASPRELSRLPRLGPAGARAIVARREARGAYSSLAELDSIPGIGPALLQAISPHVSFSGRVVGAIGESDGRVVGRSDGRGTRPRSTSDRLSNLPTVRSPYPLNINSATATELEQLPGIGPARARAIVEFRDAHGPFASTEALGQVAGVSDRVLDRLRGLIEAR